MTEAVQFSDDGTTYTIDGKTYYMVDLNARELTSNNVVFGLQLEVRCIPKGLAGELYDHLRPSIQAFLIQKGIVPPDVEQIRADQLPEAPNGKPL